MKIYIVNWCLQEFHVLARGQRDRAAFIIPGDDDELILSMMGAGHLDGSVSSSIVAKVRSLNGTRHPSGSEYLVLSMMRCNLVAFDAISRESRD